MINGKRDKLKERWENYTKSTSKIAYHKWTMMYSNVLMDSKTDNDFADLIFDQGSIEFYYPIDDNQCSLIELSKKNRTVICNLFSLFYSGIRNVMAHGVLQSTDRYTRESDYFECSQCKSKTFFTEPKNLADYYCEYVRGINDDATRNEVEKKVRRIPRHEVFAKFEGFEKKEEALRIIKDHFGKPNAQQLSASFAYFHMRRVYHWFNDKKRETYITYRMLVRVNQFFHIMAYRMYLAVIQILIKDYKMPEGFWDGITTNGIPNKIREFKEDHKQTVEKARENHIEHHHCHDFTMVTIHKFAADKVLRTTMPDNVWDVSVGTITCEQREVKMYMAIKKTEKKDTTKVTIEDDIPKAKAVRKIDETIKIN